MTTTPSVQTSTDPADTAHLRAGRRITLEEITGHVSSAAVLLRQVAYAAETPDVPVELADFIEELRRTADALAKNADTAQHLAAITAGELPLATTFEDKRTWGAAARDEEPSTAPGSYPPAVVPTYKQLLLLARRGRPIPDDHPMARWLRTETTTFPEAMDGVHFVESKVAAERRAVERLAEIQAEVLLVECDTVTCAQGEGQPCRTSTGRLTEQPHKGRLNRATLRVDERLDTLGSTVTVTRHV
ncbi:zinc finger domain-containing protein [Kitasatospora sp. NPDC094028]